MGLIQVTIMGEKACSAFLCVNLAGFRPDFFIFVLHL